MLPIHQIRENIVSALNRNQPLILTAPTGSGKSTQVPQFLLDSGSVNGIILVLQPRRLAARILAKRVAIERNVRLGSEVGFQTRFESNYSDASRIRFITEGILPRMFLSDPTLSDVGAVVFDEFHERHLSVDIGLGLVHRLRQTARPDLNVTVMSATLEESTLAAYFGDAVQVHAEGRRYPVDVTYLPPPPQQPVWESAAAALRDLIGSGAEGDVLCFMPGLFEIRRTLAACAKLKTGERLTLLPLYGDLPADHQDAVTAPAPHRKIIVATNIAETSLTIDGVRHVIDSGLARINRFDANRGLNTLFVEPISRSSAEQRAGRAGRQSAGRCLRLWTQREHENRPDHEDAEIRRVDLAEAILQLKSLDFSQLETFPWLEPPPLAAVDRAVRLLIGLGALDSHEGKLTPMGADLSHLPAHPRLARLLIEAGRRGCLQDAALVAALISERPIITSGKEGSKAFADAFATTRFSDRAERRKPRADALQSDLFALINAAVHAREIDFDVETCRNLGIHANATRQVWRTCEYLLHVCRRCGLDPAAPNTPSSRSTSHAPRRDDEALLKALLLAMPDHLGKRRDTGTLICDLSDGRRGELARSSTARNITLFIAADIREVGVHGRSPKILLSMISEIRKQWLRDLFPDDWQCESHTVWNSVKRQVDNREVVRCRNLVIEEQRSRDVDPTAAAEMLAREARENRQQLKGWTKNVDQWINRVRCVGEWFPDRRLIGYGDAETEVALQEFCSGETRFGALRDKPFLPFVRNLLSTDDQQFVERMAPPFIVLPSERKMRIRYRPGQPPKGNARIQDLYDLESTPVIAGGRAKLLVEILGPNMRPVQTTDDLEGFWRNLYPDVKKELARRYPKHEWR